MVICDDPLPTHRVIVGKKYDPLIRAMKMGQAIKCLPSEVGGVAGAMRKYIESKKLAAHVKTVKDYGDGKGRVWMRADEPATDTQPAPVVKALKSVRG